MAINVFPAPAAASKTMFRTTLTSGTSYTVPAGVTYINATLVGGGGGGGGSNDSTILGPFGIGGQVMNSTLVTTPGSTIAYAIGSGGAASAFGTDGGAGGTTTMTGATSALGGAGGRQPGASGAAGVAGISAANGGAGGPKGNPSVSGAGGAGYIIIEYWL